MQSKKERKVGHRLALILFICGLATIVLMYVGTGKSEDLVSFLIGLTGALAVINLLYLGRLFLRIVKDKGDRKKLYKTCMVMLINVPFLLSFAFVGMVLKTNLRITFTNSTSMALTDVKLIGCEDYTIPTLGVGKSKTVWVDVLKDCSVSIVYKHNGEETREEVVGYATPGYGERVKYAIGNGKIK